MSVYRVSVNADTRAVRLVTVAVLVLVPVYHTPLLTGLTDSVLTDEHRERPRCRRSCCNGLKGGVPRAKDPHKSGGERIVKRTENARGKPGRLDLRVQPKS